MKTSIQQAQALLPGPPTTQYPEGAPSVTMLQHGSMLLKVFNPSTNLAGLDRQAPHDQDELYLVHSGSATAVIGAEAFPAGPGDAFFVAAGMAHRFDDVSSDFLTWVVFYGPPGGETP
jgi:mannose-6-phosphate isomerase-like protein (cupin superfamily)